MIIEQLSLDFSQPINRRENNAESQQILNENGLRLNKQCEIVYNALMNGERLTTGKALLKYKIGDLRRRVKDLRDVHKVPVQSELVDGRFKEYFINT